MSDPDGTFTQAQIIQASIVDLEMKQHRALRELALGSTTALARVQAIDAQIAALRAQLT